MIVIIISITSIIILALPEAAYAIWNLTVGHEEKSAEGPWSARVIDRQIKTYISNIYIYIERERGRERDIDIIVCIHMYVCMYVVVCLSLSLYIYIYREREIQMCMYIRICLPDLYIYIYIYMYRERERFGCVYSYTEVMLCCLSCVCGIMFNICWIDCTKCCVNDWHPYCRTRSHVLLPNATCGNTNRVVSNRVVSKGPLYPSNTKIIICFVFWYDPV